MWTILLIFASAMLMAESYQDHDPLHSPHHTTTIVCMVPGPYENGKKRFVQDPMRTVIEEPRLRLPLLPGENPDDCWELPPIEVKQPYLPKDEDELAELYVILDEFLNPSSQERMITRNETVPMPIVASDPNDVFGINRPPYMIPESYLDEFTDAERAIIMQYAAATDIGQCGLNPQEKKRPPFYYPPYQVQGVCDGRECSLPPTDDHDFSQRCRPEVGGDDQIYIEALRWDCCHSWTIAQEYEYICGWRKVEVPVVHKCVCSCPPSEQLQ